MNARVLRCPIRGGRSLTCCQPFLLMHVHSARDCWMKSTCHVEDGYAVVAGIEFNWLMFRDELRKLTLEFVSKPPVHLRPVRPIGGVETMNDMPYLKFLGSTPEAVCERIWELFKSMPRTFKQLDPIQPSCAELLGVLANDINPWFSRCGVCVPLPWDDYFRCKIGMEDESQDPKEVCLAKVVALIFFSFVCSRAFCMDTTILIGNLHQRNGSSNASSSSNNVASSRITSNKNNSSNSALLRRTASSNLGSVTRGGS